MNSCFPKQGSGALRKLNKKIDENLLEIEVNFIAEKGVTYTNAKGAEVAKGEIYQFQTNTNNPLALATLDSSPNRGYSSMRMTTNRTPIKTGVITGEKSLIEVPKFGSSTPMEIKRRFKSKNSARERIKVEGNVPNDFVMIDTTNNTIYQTLMSSFRSS